MTETPPEYTGRDWVATWLDGLEREADLLDSLAAAKAQLRNYEDPLIEMHMGTWGPLAGHVPIRLSGLRRMRQGICRLFGVPYAAEWKAEEKRLTHGNAPPLPSPKPLWGLAINEP